MAKTGSRISANLARDDSRNPIQTGGSIQTSDATASPKVSPLAYSSSVITITIPDTAIECILNPTTDLRISELSAMTNYDIVAAGTKESIPVAKMQSLYIVRDAADGSVRFRFTLI